MESLWRGEQIWWRQRNCYNLSFLTLPQFKVLSLWHQNQLTLNLLHLENASFLSGRPEQPDDGHKCEGKSGTSGHVDPFPFHRAAGMSRASGGGRRGKRGRRWMTRGRGIYWPATATPPLWPSLTSDSTWSVGRRFYIGKGRNPRACGFKLPLPFFFPSL